MGRGFESLRRLRFLRLNGGPVSALLASPRAKYTFNYTLGGVNSLNWRPGAPSRDSRDLRSRFWLFVKEIIQSGGGLVLESHQHVRVQVGLMVMLECPRTSCTTFKSRPCANSSDAQA
jgi:hypothetical protein